MITASRTPGGTAFPWLSVSLAVSGKRDAALNRDQQGVLEQYLEAGHLVLDGSLGATAVSVVITPYAQARMRQRDIDEAELLAALADRPSSHGKGKTDGRFEVAAITDRGRVRVIYERPTPEIVLVITAYPELD